jgi:hypothetical protein
MQNALEINLCYMLIKFQNIQIFTYVLMIIALYCALTCSEVEVLHWFETVFFVNIKAYHVQKESLNKRKSI